MDHAALKTYILADAALSALQSSGDYDGIRLLLNAKMIPAYGMVDRSNFSIWAASTGMRATIQDVANDALSPLRASALSLLDLLGGGAESIDFGRAENIALLNAWESAGKLSAANKTALLALAAAHISVAEQQFGADVTLHDLWEAFK